MTAFQGGNAERQTREIMETAKITELRRIADAIFKLGQTSAPKPSVTWMSMANETASIANALETILEEDNQFKKMSALRELLTKIRAYSQKYRENHEAEAMDELEEMAAEEEKRDATE